MSDLDLIHRLTRMGLIDPEDHDIVARLLVEARDVRIGRLDEDGLYSVTQAMGRGVDRIAAAGAEVVIGELAKLPPEEREAALSEWIAVAVTTGREAFGVLYARRLERIVRRRLAAAHDSVSDITVAFVDLRGSTAFMLERTSAEIAELSDLLYEAGTEAATVHDVSAGKFLGDGVLLLTAHGGNVLDAALLTIRLLGERTPLRAGGGMARGEVIRRGGDWFGTPVNLAARLAEQASPGELLVDADAVPPQTEPDQWRALIPRGLATARRVGVLAAS